MPMVPAAVRQTFLPGWVLTAVGVVAVALLALPVAGLAAPEVEDLPDELLIGFEEGVSDSDADDAITTAGAARLEKLQRLRTHRLRVPPAALAAIERALARRKGVAFIERNRLHTVTLTPDDPQFKSQYHLPRIDAVRSWDITQGAPEIVIAIIDTGVDTKHPDLAAKMLPGFNFYDNNTDPSDPHGHGTKVAGSAAAISNNAVGVTGVSWNSKILPLRVGSPTGSASTFNIAKAMTYAVDNGAKVINLSWAGMAGSNTVNAAAKDANAKGVVVVAGAGNCGCTETFVDSLYIISVSATDSGDKLASFSSRGNFVDVAAPGVSILTTAKGGGYATVSGTSFSGPITAGVVALMMAINPTLTPSDIDALLKANADELGTAGWDPNFGYGRINAFRAVTAAAASSPLGLPPPPAPAPPPAPPADIASLTATAAVSGAQIDLAWTNPVASDFAGVLVLRKSGSPVTEAPSAGTAYTVGQLLGGSTVVYASEGTSLSNTGLPDATTQHYRAFSFSTAKLYSTGVSASATPAAPVSCPAEVIIDNLAAGQASSQVSFTGTWSTSGAASPYGANGSLYSSGAALDTYTWKTGVLNGAAACTYDVYTWWTSHVNRSTAVPITVSGHTGSSTTKPFDQKTGGGMWQLHGQYAFAAGSTASVQVTDAKGQAAADAVRLVLATATAPPPPPPPAAEIIIDNSTSGTILTGSWCVSGSAGFFGTNSLYSCGSALDKYRWTPTIPAAGTYDVYVWWTSHVNRSTAVPITVSGHTGGSTTKTFDQKTGGGTWQLHGQYSFNAGTAGFVEVTDAAGQAAADAVRFVPVTTTSPVQSP